MATYHLPYYGILSHPLISFSLLYPSIFLVKVSFIAIRFLGVLFVTISSFYTYKFTLTNTNRKAAIIIGLITVSLQSMFGSLQGVMSEHISMAFLMPC